MWNFWIDRGGTFTDVVAIDPNGKSFKKKLLSESDYYKDAAVFAIKNFLQLEEDQSIHKDSIASIKMGTTVATNALLEHQGEPVVLAITQGFADALRIAYQNRPEIFALNIKLPKELYEKVIEIDERIDAKGKIIQKLDIENAKDKLQKYYDKGYRSLAIVLMHSYCNSQHETVLNDLAKKIGFTTIAISHELSPLIKLISRGQTAVLEAYLAPKLQDYIDHIKNEFQNTSLFFMQSNGGLISAKDFRAKDSILSGPAGGFIGAVKVAQQAKIDKIISFDMGGTSTDVAHYAGELERQTQMQIAGVNLTAPTLQIHTVAAGGGSILNYKYQRFQVGPDSAGAKPGPACYGLGGPLTVTDANVFLGRIQANYFPTVFGKDGKSAIDVDIVKQKFVSLTKKINQKSSKKFQPHEVASGFLKVAISNMANAIKKISIERGYDVSEYTLVSFGGAGGQHACDVADELGIESVLLHPNAGVLSAYGIGLAELRLIQEQTIEKPFVLQCLDTVAKKLEQLVIKSKQALLKQDANIQSIEVLQFLRLRYHGNQTTVDVPLQDFKKMQQAFEHEFKQQFGYLLSHQAITIEAAVVEAIGSTPQIVQSNDKFLKANLVAQPADHVDMFDGVDVQNVPVYLRQQLPIDRIIKGPAVIIEPNCTIVVTRGWQAKKTKEDNILLTRYQKKKIAIKQEQVVDPIKLEIFNNLFMSIAEQMGVALQKTSYSVNVKERLDYSCAIFDSQGHLIANAPHIPVHLGSMGESVRAIINDKNIVLKAGDVYVLNDPYQGGTHLPDITVVTPVFFSDYEKAVFYVASRAHHADIGGITPGSIPARSQHIDEEGVLIKNFCLVKNHKFMEEDLFQLLRQAKYPARNPQQNIADLKAQVAANQKGVNELLKMIQHFSFNIVQAYTQYVQNNAAMTVQLALTKITNGKFCYSMDNGAKICVAITVDHNAKRAIVDFTGSSDAQNNNFNAPKAVTIAAVLYVFRTLVGEKIPLNEGCLLPLDTIIPENSILNPTYPHAVVAGNVETSQVIVDALYGALKILAASQGTMNNLTFGNEHYQYYETICGGSGAGKNFHGTSAVHTHMTNSLLTDPEVLEHRFPVNVLDFSIRKHSGGQGKFHGGDGVTRTLLFLEPMQGAIVSNHRKISPFGLEGGEAGQIGKNYIIRKNGKVEALAGTDEFALHSGDKLVIETPGGGGYGEK